MEGIIKVREEINAKEIKCKGSMKQRVHFWKGKWDQQTLIPINKWKDKKIPNKKNQKWRCFNEYEWNPENA